MGDVLLKTWQTACSIVCATANAPGPHSTMCAGERHKGWVARTRRRRIRLGLPGVSTMDVRELGRGRVQGSGWRGPS